MKTISKLALVLLIFIVGISTNVQAQLSFGLKGGMNVCSIMNYDNIDLPNMTTAPFSADGSSAYRFGYNAGLFLSFAVADNRLAFQPEILFSQQGMKNSGKLFGIEGSKSETTIRTDYINIPMLIQFYFIRRVFYVEAGPQVGFMVNSSAKYTLDIDAGAFQGHHEHIWDIGDNLNTVDFSFAFGLGFQIPSLPIGINARYTIGVTNVSKNDTENNGTYNSVFQLGAFLKFGNSGN